jgi:WD40 repeat protein/energy-coupling factor transporter ATP-binding protein EcfA2
LTALFISHSSQDDAYAARLVERLRQAGFAALFLDFDQESGIPVGRDWQRELFAQLARVDGVVFVATPSSLASRWCNVELGVARFLAKPVFPLLLSGNGRHPLLDHAQWADASSDEEAGFTRLLTGLGQAGLRPKDSFEWDQTRSPYPGLMAFTEADAAVFFGRDSEIRRLLQRLTPAAVHEGGQLVAVVGPSGSGKSSLVRAGLLPRLAQQSGRWALLDPVVPGVGLGPIPNLARSLAGHLGSPDPVEVDKALAAGPSHLVGLLEDIRAATGHTEAQVLLVVDQAEELVTRCSDEEQDAFAGLLAGAVGPGSPLWVVATLRSEFVGQFASKESTAALVAEPMVIGPVRRERLPTVIARPATWAGIDFEPGLVERMVVETEGGDALPLLAYTLQQLTERHQPGEQISTTDYERLGGVVGTLTRQADHIRANLERRGAGEAVLPTLTRLSTVDRLSNPAGRRVLYDRFTGHEASVIQSFIEARLLRTEVQDGVTMVAVAHEALLRQWQPLRDHIRANRQLILLEGEIERQARDWETYDRDESYLLRGARLAEAQAMPDHVVQQLGTSAQEYLAASDASQAADLEAARRYNLRSRRLVVALGVLLLAVTAVGGAFRVARDQAQAQTQVGVSRGLAARASSLLGDGRAEALLVALEGVRVEPTHEVIDVLISGLSEPLHPVRDLHGHDRPVQAVAYSPDGSTISSADGSTLRRWDAADGTPIGDPFPGYNGTPEAVFHNSHGTTLASASLATDLFWLDGQARYRLRIWDASDGALLVERLLDGPVDSMAFSPNGTTILSAGGDDGTLRRWDATDGAPIGDPLGRHGGRVSAIAYSAGGTTIISAGVDGTLRRWDATDGAPIGDPLRGHNGPVEAVVYSTEGTTFVSAGSDGTLRRWDATDGAPIGDPLRGHTGPVRTAAYSPDGSRIVSGSDDGTLRLWDATDGSLLGEPLTGHDGGVSVAAYSPDGERIVSGGDDGILRLWDATHRAALLGEPLISHDGEVTAVAYSPDSTTIVASGGRNGDLRQWNATDGAPIGDPLRGHAGPALALTYSPDGATIVAAGGQSMVALPIDDYGTLVGENALWRWDAADGTLLGDPLRGHDGPVRAVAYSPNGATIVSASDDGTLQRWNAADGTLLGDPLRGHDGPVWAVAYSPNGNSFVSGSDDGTLQRWNAVDGSPLGDPLRGHEGPVEAVAYSVDGTRIVSASGVPRRPITVDKDDMIAPTDNELRLWNAFEGTPVGQPLRGHDGPVRAVAYSPNDTTIVSGSSDGTLRLWDAAEGRQLGAALTGHDGPVHAVVYSPDGTAIVSAGSDGTVRRWMAPASWVAGICNVVNRNLSQAEWDDWIGPESDYVRTCPMLPPGQGAPVDAPAAQYPSWLASIPPMSEVEP